jgi:hypothetical protein
MLLKLLLVVLASLLQIFSVLFSSEAQLRRRPQGRKLLEFIENRTRSVTDWRANADIREELEKIKGVCVRSLVGLIFLTFIAAVFRFQWLAILIGPFVVVSFFGYISLEWILKWRTFLKFYSGMFLLLTAAISFGYYSDLSQYWQLAHVSVRIVRIVGITDPVPSLTLTLLVSAVVFVSLLLLTTLIVVTVSLGIFTPLWLTSRLSLFLRRKFNKDVLWWTVLLTQIFVVILAGIVSML